MSVPLGSTFQKEDGVVTQQDRGQERIGNVCASQSSKPKKEDGARAQKAGHQKEDGATAQKASRPKEDGARAHQKEAGARAQKGFVKKEGIEVPEAEKLIQSEGSSSEGECDSSGGSGQEDGSVGQQGPGACAQSSQDQTVQVLLKIVEGMQTMQQKMMSGAEPGKDEAELVRFSPELPRLPEWNPESAPIDFADWITCLHTYMSDLSNTSKTWWDQTLQTAKDWYGAN